MSYSNKQVPTVQAGSMADIAFLLLIFFLIATKVPNDKGLARKLPSECVNPPCEVKYLEKNILEIVLNSKDEIFVNNEVIQIKDLKHIVKKFVDNNGDNSCSYCNGENLNSSSENPEMAVVSLVSHRESSYKFFIEVQDEITEAYYELRANYANTKFKMSYNSLSTNQINDAKEAYPFKLSEAIIK